MTSLAGILLYLTTRLLKTWKWLALKLRNPYKKFAILHAMTSDQRLLDTSLNWSTQWNFSLSKIWKICTDFWRLRLSVQTTKRHSEFCMISIFQSCSHICYFVQLFSTILYTFEITLAGVRVREEEEDYFGKKRNSNLTVFAILVNFFLVLPKFGRMFVCVYVCRHVYNFDCSQPVQPTALKLWHSIPDVTI